MRQIVANLPASHLFSTLTNSEIVQSGKVGLMTHLDTAFPLVRLKSSEQTFIGTQIYAPENVRHIGSLHGTKRRDAVICTQNSVRPLVASSRTCEASIASFHQYLFHRFRALHIVCCDVCFFSWIFPQVE